MLFPRTHLEDIEAQTLAPYAVLSQDGDRRIYPEPEDRDRLCFQKDRDRIIHSRAFRRLKAKTQVFVSHFGDHYRTRLTHSLEVSQISRDIARSFGLNQDLCEAIALAHDLGHPPFGHAGEHALDIIMQKFDSHFEHNEQSKRIVEELETVYPNFPGLNLTHDVREGLMKHKSSWDNFDKEFKYLSLEAQVVNLADEIAYQVHDIDDGLRCGILTIEDLQPLDLIQQTIEEIHTRYSFKLSRRMNRVCVVKTLMSIMIKDLSEETERRLKKNNIRTITDVKSFPDSLVSMSLQFAQANRQLKRYLFEHFYLHSAVSDQSRQGQNIIAEVFWMYYNNPLLLPKKLQRKIEHGEKKEIVVKDYVAGMTDKFAQERLTMKEEAKVNLV